MMTLVTGGSASGKSRFAERLACRFNGEKYYLATMKNDSCESDERIKKHRQMRDGKGFITIEKPHNIADTDLKGTVLLECLGNLLANEMFGNSRTADDVFNDIITLYKSCENMVIVTNEISSDGACYDEFTIEYMRSLGMLNCRLAQISDEVVEVVSGCPIYIKGGVA